MRRVISDTRLQFSIIQGYAVMIGFPMEAELKSWGRMEMLDSDELRAKVEELENGEIRLNCAWLTVSSE